MAELLSRNYPITWQFVLAQVREGGKTTVGRLHIVDVLVSAGIYRTRSEAFVDATSASSKCYILAPSPTSHEMVAVVKGASSVILIAHAGDVNRSRRLLSDDQIEALISEELDGLGVWHRGNSPGQRERLLTICHRHQLSVTGGSDWHDKDEPNKLEEDLTDETIVEEIVRRGTLSLYR